MAYSERAHELMMLLTCSLTDSLLEMVTPNTFKDLTRVIPGSGGGGSSERLFLLSENTISADFDQFSARLFLLDHSAIHLLLSAVNITRRDDQVRVISILYQRVVCSHRLKVSSMDNIRGGPNR